MLQRDIGGAEGWGSISGIKGTEKTIFEEVCFSGCIELRSRYIVCLSNLGRYDK